MFYIFNIVCRWFDIEAADMTFHEKTRWIALFANVLLWGWYFVHFAPVFGVHWAGGIAPTEIAPSIAVQAGGGSAGGVPAGGVTMGGVHPSAARAMFGGMAIAVFWTVVIQIIATTAIAIHRPKEANAPRDERERAITRNAASSAYTLLSFGVVVIIVAAYLALDYLAAMNLLLLTFIAVECVRYILEIISYRRGSHG